jgi:hypothetical protein
MTIQTMNLEGFSPISVQDLLRPFDKVEYSAFERSLIEEKAQMRDQIEMLEREVDRQETIIDALVKAIKVIERG